MMAQLLQQDCELHMGMHDIESMIQLQHHSDDPGVGVQRLTSHWRLEDTSVSFEQLSLVWRSMCVCCKYPQKICLCFGSSEF